MADRSLEHYLALRYRYELYAPEDDEDLWAAEHPDLPGCIAQGESPDEAVSALDDARDLWITVQLESGDPVPEPAEDEYSGRVTLRMSRLLHRRVATRAQQQGVSLNAYLNEAATTYVTRGEDKAAVEGAAKDLLAMSSWNVVTVPTHPAANLFQFGPVRTSGSPIWSDQDIGMRQRQGDRTVATRPREPVQ